MPGRSFIERAVECADTNALRMALYQATRDAEIAAITPERVFGPTTDAIVFSDEDTALEVVLESRPDIYAKGGDYDMRVLPETALVESWGGRALAIPFEFNRSTTALVRKIRG